MSRVIVVGGGLIGLATALLVAKQGHDVTVLERDPAEPPATAAEAWDAWERPGIMQFRIVHVLLAGGRRVLDEHLPEAAAALWAAGADTFNGLDYLPRNITDRASRAGDERFPTFAARRPLIEYAMMQVAAPTVDIRRGVHVTGLLSDGHQRVTGVSTRGGDLPADLVIDAMGRRSPLPQWLAAIGAGVPAEESEDLGFTYYGRFYRTPPGATPPRHIAVGLWHFDCYSLLMLPSEGGTWSITAVVTGKDTALRALREEDNFTRLVGACPLHAPSLDGEPVTGMLAAAGITERRRDLVVNGAPVATGVLAVGDSAHCTNPSVGRGMTLGLMHAVLTAQAIAEHPDDPVALALTQQRLTRERLLPWYDVTVQADRQRAAQVAAAIAGRPAAPAPAGASAAGPPAINRAAAGMRDLMTARLLDPDGYRAYLEIVNVLALPQEILSRPGFADHLSQVADGHAPALPPGPTRDELLRMLS